MEKDIRRDKKSETCVFIPDEVNVVFIDVKCAGLMMRVVPLSVSLELEIMYLEVQYLLFNIYDYYYIYI